MTTVKLPWQYGFRQEICVNGWRHIGIYPSNRSMYLMYLDLLLEKGEVLEAVEEVEDTGFDIKSINWSVILARISVTSRRKMTKKETLHQRFGSHQVISYFVVQPTLSRTGLRLERRKT